MAIHAEATAPTEPMRRPGTPHTRASTPSATATVNSPAKRAGLAARAASGRASLPVARCTTNTATPSPNTERAGSGSIRTITVAPMTPIMPAPHWGETGSISSRVVAFRSARRHTTSTAMVTTTAAAQAGAAVGSQPRMNLHSRCHRGGPTDWSDSSPEAEGMPSWT